MGRFLKQKKAQSTLEYAVLIAAVVGGLVAMNTYTKRAVQGRVRSAVDDIGAQYSAGNVTSKYQTTHEETVTTEKFGTTAAYNAADLGVGTATPTAAHNQGVSRYDVVTPGIVTRETIEGQKEKITKKFSEETIYEK